MNQVNATPETSTPNKLALVVDDDAFSQEFFSEMLGELQVGEVHSASNGRTALRILAGLPRQPDLLICDVFMPDMDGIEFLGELSKMRYAGGIMLVSGLDVTMMAIAQQVALEDGLKLLGAFTKPVPMAILAETLIKAEALHHA